MTEGVKYTRNNPFQAAVLANYLLTGERSEKATRHVELSIEQGMTYLVRVVLPAAVEEAVDGEEGGDREEAAETGTGVEAAGVCAGVGTVPEEAAARAEEPEWQNEETDEEREKGDDEKDGEEDEECEHGGLGVDVALEVGL